jgi:hypothetical protein
MLSWASPEVDQTPIKPPLAHQVPGRSAGAWPAAVHMFRRFASPGHSHPGGAGKPEGVRRQAIGRCDCPRDADSGPTYAADSGGMDCPRACRPRGAANDWPWRNTHPRRVFRPFRSCSADGPRPRALPRASIFRPFGAEDHGGEAACRSSASLRIP